MRIVILHHPPHALKESHKGYLRSTACIPNVFKTNNPVRQFMTKSERPEPKVDATYVAATPDTTANTASASTQVMENTS